MDLIREHWSDNDYEMFKEYLKSLCEQKYKEFSKKLIPNTPLLYGIRIPLLRKIAKEISKGNYAEFLSCKKSKYHEEIIIEGLVMAQIKCDYPQMLSYMKSFADKIYNWAICDIVSFKGLKKYLDLFINDVDYFIYNKNPWVVRFGFGCLMEFYLTDEYIDKVLFYTASINSDFYYVQMMQAWLVATAAAKKRDKTITFLEAKKLNPVTQNMAIKKIRESYRISKEDKELVNNFKYIK
jgi:3-methyladenine DNA glycosylase AlkD